MAYCELRSVTIRATSRAGKPGQVDFMLSGDQVQGETIKCEKKNTMKAKDPHLFVFGLDADPNLKLRFLKDPDAVMQIVSENGGANPCKPNKELGFEVISVSDDTLIVSNLNGKPCDYKFTLNFVGTSPDGASHFIPYDPIWGNGNGGAP